MTNDGNPAFDLRPRPYDPDHLSPTSVSNYTGCGLRWRLGHVDGIKPIKQSLATALGTALHAGMRPYWKGNPATFLQQWKKYKGSEAIDFRASKLSWLDWYSRGEQMSQALMRTLDDHFDPATSKTEISYDLDLGFIKLFRRIDVYTEAKSLPVLVGGTVEKVDGFILLDLKSSGKKYADNAVNFSGQLKLYSVPGRDRLLEPTMAVYAVVTKSAKPLVQLIGKRYSKDELRAELQTVKQVADNIRAGVFVKNSGEHCNYCDFRYLCTHRVDNWRELYHIPKESPNERALAPGEELPGVRGVQPRSA